MKRPLKFRDVEIFIRHWTGVNILEKVLDRADKMLEDYVSTRKPFGIESNIVNSSAYHSKPDMLERPVSCYGKNQKIGYIEYDDVPANKEWIGRWKVFTARANNIGTELNDDNLNAFVGKDEICTESYMVIGAELNLTQEEAENIVKYLQTRFARFCHSLAKASQDATAKTYRFVPMQDFSAASAIDWSQDIAAIDQQLYARYELSAAEIDFIERIIKPM